MTKIFADLNDRDSLGQFCALAEDADGPVSTGDTVRVVDDEDSIYTATVTSIEDGLIFFVIEPGSARRVAGMASTALRT